MTTAVKGLTDAMQKNIGAVLTLQGDEVGWQQSLQAATKQLNSNSAGLQGNSADALANKAAVVQTTQQRDDVRRGPAERSATTCSAASRVIQDQIHWLQVHGGKSKFATGEIHALRMEEGKLKAAIRQKMIVDAVRDTGRCCPAARGRRHPGPDQRRRPGRVHPHRAAGRR